jgi:hypothetical protein
MDSDPLRDDTLLLFVQRKLRGALLLILFPASPQIRPKSAMGFERDISCRDFVGCCVEDHAAESRCEVAALRRRRRMDERALCRIAEEGLRDLRSPLTIGFTPLGFGGVAFGLVCALELMIPRGLAEQVLDLGRPS